MKSLVRMLIFIGISYRKEPGAGDNAAPACPWCAYRWYPDRQRQRHTAW